MTERMIEVAGLTTGYGRRRAGGEVLKAVCCSVARGSMTVLVGANGSGKSTLLKALCGFLPAWTGTVRLAGAPLATYTNMRRARLVAYLAQSSAARSAPDVTVRRLVLHGRFPYTRFPRQYGARDRAVVDGALEQLGLLSLADEPLTALSGGQRQKAYLAMALAQQTPLLVLDEPLTFLDIRQQLELLATLRRLQTQGKTICMVVHDLNMALACADEVLVLDGGAVVEQGGAAAVVASGVLDRVFAVKSAAVSLPDGGQLYTFSLPKHRNKTEPLP